MFQSCVEPTRPGLLDWLCTVNLFCTSMSSIRFDLAFGMTAHTFSEKWKKNVTLHKYNVKRSTEGCSWIRHIRFLWGGGLVFWEYRLERGLEDWRSKERLSACFDVKYRWRIITPASVQTDAGAAVCHSDRIRCGHGSGSIGLLMQLQSNTNTLSISVVCGFSELTQPWAESRRDALASHLGPSPPWFYHAGSQGDQLRSDGKKWSSGVWRVWLILRMIKNASLYQSRSWK